MHSFPVLFHLLDCLKNKSITTLQGVQDELFQESLATIALQVAFYKKWSWKFND